MKKIILLGYMGCGKSTIAKLLAISSSISDLDLDEIIEWCRNNDDKCKEIAKNAFKFYNKYLTKEGIEAIEQQGTWVTDEEDDFATPMILCSRLF